MDRSHHPMPRQPIFTVALIHSLRTYQKHEIDHEDHVLDAAHPRVEITPFVRHGWNFSLNWNGTHVRYYSSWIKSCKIPGAISQKIKKSSKAWKNNSDLNDRQLNSGCPYVNCTLLHDILSSRSVICNRYSQEQRFSCDKRVTVLVGLVRYFAMLQDQKGGFTIARNSYSLRLRNFGCYWMFYYESMVDVLLWEYYLVSSSWLPLSI